MTSCKIWQYLASILCYAKYSVLYTVLAQCVTLFCNPPPLLLAWRHVWTAPYFGMIEIDGTSGNWSWTAQKRCWPLLIPQAYKLTIIKEKGCYFYLLVIARNLNNNKINQDNFLCIYILINILYSLNEVYYLWYNYHLARSNYPNSVFEARFVS